jgi:hypothetical protein
VSPWRVDTVALVSEVDDINRKLEKSDQLSQESGSHQQMLETDKSEVPSDDGWTVVQSKTTTKAVIKTKSIVGAETKGRQQNEMVPTKANKRSTALMSYADSVKGMNSGCSVIANGGSCKCSCLDTVATLLYQIMRPRT